MLDHTTLNSIAELFGLKGLNNRLRQEVDKNGNIIYALIPQLIWMAEIDRYDFVPDDITSRKLILAGFSGKEKTVVPGQSFIRPDEPPTSYSPVQRCVILLSPKKLSQWDNFVFDPPLLPITLSEDEAYVTTALSQMNLTEVRQDWRFQRYDGGTFEIRLTVYAQPILFELSVSGANTGEHPALETLWRAIRKTVYKLAEKYNNEMLNHFIGINAQ